MKLQRREEVKVVRWIEWDFKSADLAEINDILKKSYIGVGEPLVVGYDEIQAVWEGNLSILKDKKWNQCLYMDFGVETNAFYLVDKWLTNFISMFPYDVESEAIEDWEHYTE